GSVVCHRRNSSLLPRGADLPLAVSSDVLEVFPPARNLLLRNARVRLGGRAGKRTALCVVFMAAPRPLSQPHPLAPPSHEIRLFFDLSVDGLFKQWPILHLRGECDQAIGLGQVGPRLVWSKRYDVAGARDGETAGAHSAPPSSLSTAARASR